MKVKITRYYSDAFGNPESKASKESCIVITIPDTTIEEFKHKRLGRQPRKIEITLDSPDQVWPIKNGVKELFPMGDGRFQSQESVVIDEKELIDEQV